MAGEAEEKSYIPDLFRRGAVLELEHDDVEYTHFAILMRFDKWARRMMSGMEEGSLECPEEH